MGMSYNEVQASIRIENIIKLISNMNAEHGDTAAQSLDAFVIEELEEVKRLLSLD